MPFSNLFASSQALSVFSTTFSGVAFVLFLSVFVGAPLCVILPASVWLAPAQSAEAVITTERDFAITLRADGSLLFGQMYIRPNQLASHLAQEVQLGRDRAVLLRIDRRVSFRRVRHLMQEIKNAGFVRAYVVTFEGPVLKLLAQDPAA